MTWGRNLLLNTAQFREETPFEKTASGTDNWMASFDGKRIYCPIPFKKGDVITFQAKSDKPWAKLHGGSANNTGTVGFWLYLGTLKQVKEGSYTNPCFFAYDGVSTEFVKTWTISEQPSIGEDIYIAFRWNTYSYDNVPLTANLWDIKLELGSEATPYSPAPEDLGGGK